MFPCMYVCIMNMPGAHEGRRGCYLLRLELQTVVSHRIGTRNPSPLQGQQVPLAAGAGVPASSTVF